MAHELDTTTGKAGIAYAAGSAVPWHGMGQTVSPDSSVEEWRKAGGLDWDAVRTEVIFNGQNDEYAFWPDKHVLYRSDTGRPLSVVSKDYQTVQPAHILGFFKELADKGDFQIETVGSLKEGRRIWALAHVDRIRTTNSAPGLPPSTFAATGHVEHVTTRSKRQEYTSWHVSGRNVAKGEHSNDIVRKD